MTDLDSLPYPVDPQDLEALEDHDEIEQIAPIVVSARLGEGTLVPAFLITTTSDRIAVVEDRMERSYRVLSRGESAFDDIQDWCDRNGFE